MIEVSELTLALIAVGSSLFTVVVTKIWDAIINTINIRKNNAKEKAKIYFQNELEAIRDLSGKCLIAQQELQTLSSLLNLFLMNCDQFDDTEGVDSFIGSDFLINVTDAVGDVSETIRKESLFLPAIVCDKFKSIDELSNTLFFEVARMKTYLTDAIKEKKVVNEDDFLQYCSPRLKYISDGAGQIDEMQINLKEYVMKNIKI